MSATDKGLAATRRTVLRERSAARKLGAYLRGAAPSLELHCETKHKRPAFQRRFTRKDAFVLARLPGALVLTAHRHQRRAGFRVMQLLRTKAPRVLVKSRKRRAIEQLQVRAVCLRAWYAEPGMLIQRAAVPDARARRTAASDVRSST
eukprot:137722-Rhodomonas_salina.2